MKQLCCTPSSQDTWVIAEEGEGSLGESETVNESKGARFSRHNRTAVMVMTLCIWYMSMETSSWQVTDVGRANHMWHHPWAGGPGWYRKQSGQAKGSQPFSSISFSSCLQSFPWWTAWSRMCKSNKVFPVQVAFGYGLDHSNRNLRRPLRLLGRILHPREEFLMERRLLGQLRVYMEVGKPRKAKGSWNDLQLCSLLTQKPTPMSIIHLKSTLMCGSLPLLFFKTKKHVSMSKTEMQYSY